ncbi:rhamnogalacturonan acetylesterase [Asticcacaulis sp. AND118]|uniref:rhamnogalacturonan acetylesterase n=1 Tax=Asticcacaulis sp. AND118 TaxID=2840468 RepID=UPI001CFFF1C7|nr:rhamnogalacturonan acetylesterase [Asticcacaulis sp. AND118]UDF03175.1 rhamnogalacturonan acetylesterase [Asticcacaulis sp. AND118]
MLRRALVSALAIASILSVPAFAAPAKPADTRPVRVILVGDSTMTDKSGYGKGFCAQFKPEVTCVNAARGGRSSKSYRVEGLWDKITEQLADTSFSKTYVLIQFGHNDGSSRPERHTDIETEFGPNIRGYVRDVKKAGAVPVLVTPLTQRHFRDGKLKSDLLPWAQVTRLIARSTDTTLVDLYAEGQAKVQEMGIAESLTLAGQPVPQNVLDAAPTGTTVPAKFTDASQGQGTAQAFDYTHLGPKGSDYFGKMVVDLWVAADPKVTALVK